MVYIQAKEKTLICHNGLFSFMFINMYTNKEWTPVSFHDAKGNIVNNWFNLSTGKLFDSKSYYFTSTPEGDLAAFRSSLDDKKGAGWMNLKTRKPLFHKGRKYFSTENFAENGFAKVDIKGKYSNYHNWVDKSGALFNKIDYEGSLGDFFNGFATLEYYGKHYNIDSYGVVYTRTKSYNLKPVKDLSLQCHIRTGYTLKEINGTPYLFHGDVQLPDDVQPFVKKKKKK